MAIYDSYSALRLEIEKLQEPLRVAILSGAAKDYTNYKELCAKLTAYEQIRQMTLPQEEQKRESTTSRPSSRS